MKPIRFSLVFLFLLAAVLWSFADTFFVEPFNWFTFRIPFVRLSGIFAIAAMSAAMLLAARPAWLSARLNGLDKAYRLHKWLGIAALIAGIAHWWVAKGTKWMVGWGWLERHAKAPRPPAFGFEAWLRGQRHLAETLGEWAFYAAVAFIVLALLKKLFPYRWFQKTHWLLAVGYLALAWHSFVLLPYAYWSQPIGWLVALLLAAGSLAGVWILAGQSGKSRKHAAEVLSAKSDAEAGTTALALSCPTWPGHRAGQFAFVSLYENSLPGRLALTFVPQAEGAHPYTIASASPRLEFRIKALGDHTRALLGAAGKKLKAQIEGPYGEFDFADDAKAQAWIGAGIGVTPFLARLEELGGQKAAGLPQKAQKIVFFHPTSVLTAADEAALRAAAQKAGVELQLRVDSRGDPRLDAEAIRAALPQWKEASFWFCGPAGFGRALRQAFKADVPEGRWHQEAFEMR
jgi:predicted ferric reductase